MSMTQLIGKGLLAGSIVVAASEIAKRSALFGALVVSLPLTSIRAMMALYQDTRDAELVADFAESIVWLVIPSLALFVVLPVLLRRGWGFEGALLAGILLPSQHMPWVYGRLNLSVGWIEGKSVVAIPFFVGWGGTSSKIPHMNPKLLL